MASTQEYFDYSLDLLSEVPDVTLRKMMGGALLYASGRLFGGVYNDRLLLKATTSSTAMLPDARRELPYEGSKTEMLLVDTEDRNLLAAIVEAMLPELPTPKRK